MNVIGWAIALLAIGIGAAAASSFAAVISGERADEQRARELLPEIDRIRLNPSNTSRSDRRLQLLGKLSLMSVAGYTRLSPEERTNVVEAARWVSRTRSDERSTPAEQSRKQIEEPGGGEPA